jgi:hypothetical protein
MNKSTATVGKEQRYGFSSFQNHWVFGLWPSSGILTTTELGVSETGFVSSGEGGETSVGSLRKS